MAVKKAKKSKKGLVALIIFMVIAAMSVSAVLYFRMKNTAASTEEVSEYTVREETFENVIEITGNVSAASSQDIQSAGSGTVIGVYVKEGDFVKEGQLLLAMDATDEEYDLAKQDYDMDQKRISGSSKELELMAKQRAVLVQKIEDRKVTAYFDGIIAKLDVATGDYIEAKDSLGVLIDRSYMKATVEIVETDASKLKVNQKVNFSFPAYTDTVVEGYVLTYPAVGRITNRGATVIDAEVRIDNPPSEILPNYSFTGEIEVTAPVTTTIVERQAIGYQSGSAYAEIIQKDGTTERVDVQVRPYGTAYVSIVSGLSDGDVVKAQEDSVSGSLRIKSSTTSTTTETDKGLGDVLKGDVGNTPGTRGGMGGGAAPMNRP